MLTRAHPKGNSLVRTSKKIRAQTIARSNGVAVIKSGVIGETYVGFTLTNYDGYWLARGERADGERISMVADSLSDIAMRVAIASMHGERHEAINARSENEARWT